MNFLARRKSRRKKAAYSKADLRLLNASELFDPDWYRTRYPDEIRSGSDPVKHYLRHGANKGLDPGPAFSTLGYLKANPDIAASGLNPLVHYLRYGQAEGRSRGGQQLSLSPEDVHLLLDSKYFCADWYLRRNPDVAKAGLDPLEHYLYHGAGEGRDPSPEFSTLGYLERYPDVALAGLNPLLHYLHHGQKEGRYPGPNRRNTAPDYRNIAEFLCFALLQPLHETPFTEEAKRCFAVMEQVTRQLHRTQQSSPQRPLVSVIMPVRDRSAVVGEAIGSVLAQSYERFELIVVDDGSRDDSVQVIHSFADPRIRLLQNKESAGVSAARNRGLAAAQGDLVAYLDSDNSWLPDYLSAMVGAFLTLPDADAAYSGQYLYRHDEETPFAVRYGSFNPALLCNRNYIDLNCFVHRRAVLDRIGGGFCEQMRRLVDWELILRIAGSGRIYSVPVLQSLYHFGRTENAITDTEAIDPARQELMARSGYGYRSPGTVNRPLRRKVAVIIPSYEVLGSLQACIDSLAELARDPQLQLILVDNASGPEVTGYLRELEQAGARVLFNDYNYGFTYAVNQGAALADADADLLLLNNDASLTPGALNTLQDAAWTDDTVAITVPQQVLPANEATICTHVPYADDKLPCDVTLSAHHGNIDPLNLFHGGGPLALNFAPFFCVYIRRDVWEVCGGLDAQHGRHYRSDRIMCDYVRHVLGRRIIYTPEAVVFHHHQLATRELQAKGTDGLEFETLFTRNQWPDEVEQRLGFTRPRWED